MPTDGTSDHAETLRKLTWRYWTMECVGVAECWAEFQTLIVGAFVLVGVCATLYFNSRLARSNREEDMKSERVIIRTALSEELKIIRRALLDGIEKIEEARPDDQNLAVPRRPMIDVYNTYLHRLGLLKPRQVEKVLNSYLTVIQHHRNLLLYPGASILNDDNVLIPGVSFRYFADAHSVVLQAVEEAILCLEREHFS